MAGPLTSVAAIGAAPGFVAVGSMSAEVGDSLTLRGDGSERSTPGYLAVGGCAWAATGSSARALDAGAGTGEFAAMVGESS